jgi:hypothetical protein
VAQIDDATAVLTCRDTLEVIDVATGETKWTHSIDPYHPARTFTHDGEVWFFGADGDNKLRRIAFAALDGSELSNALVATMAEDVAWGTDGRRYEVHENGPLDSTLRFVELLVFQGDQQLAGYSAPIDSPFGLLRVEIGADGNVYVAGRERLDALSLDAQLLWAVACNDERDLALRSDGSPLVNCLGDYLLYPTSAPVDPWGHKPSVPLDANDSIREVSASTQLVTTGPTKVTLFTDDGSPIATITAPTTVGSDGFQGPEFGLLPMAGTSGALVQTPSGIGLVDYTSHQMAWTDPRFFLPLATGSQGFVGVCERPPPRTVDGPAKVADHVTICGLSETDEIQWQRSVPWENYGVTARTADGQASRFQGEHGTFTEAAVAKRWIVSGGSGTFAIAY